MARSIAAVTSGSGRNRGVLMVAAILGILSALLMFAFLSSRGGSSNSPAVTAGGGATQSAVVVTKDIQVGDKVTDDDITVEPVAANALLPGHLVSTKDVVGKIATAPMFAGEQVIPEKVTTFVGQTTLAYKVPAGMRAVSIQVPQESWIVGGLPQPGDFVDFLAITTLTKTDPLTGNQTPDVQAGLIAQNVQVLAIAQTMVDSVPNVDAATTPAAGSTAGTTQGAAATASPVASGAVKPGGKDATFEKAVSVTLALPIDVAARVELVDAMKKDVGQWRLLLRQKGDTSIVTGTTKWTYDDLFAPSASTK
ncbi:MAG TPA: Flp pilus assembly protein CpaB [Tepidiformaceae bacterium]|nr:Flp pilus assembly protein CpaB [Tepidiformaceae bacterium]